MGRPAKGVPSSSSASGYGAPMTNDLSRSRTLLDQDSTLIAVVELSLSSWVVAGIVPGIDRHF